MSVACLGEMLRTSTNHQYIEPYISLGEDWAVRVYNWVPVYPDCKNEDKELNIELGNLNVT